MGEWGGGGARGLLVEIRDPRLGVGRGGEGGCDAIPLIKYCSRVKADS